VQRREGGKEDKEEESMGLGCGLSLLLRPPRLRQSQELLRELQEQELVEEGWEAAR